MSFKYKHQIMTALSFGVTSAVITSLGMIVGVYSATSSRLAVAASIIVMAIADGMADAAGIHLSEESEMNGNKPEHTHKEVWLTTIFTFLCDGGFILTFAVPILLFSLKTAVLLSVTWGVFLIVVVNNYIARKKAEPPWRLIIEHLLLAAVVIFISIWVGYFISLWIH